MARLGKYELLERIAVGGMAEVFVARMRGEAGFERRVAIKQILPGLSEDTEFAHLLADEARLTVLLEHPGIAQVYDLDRAEGRLYLAMEYVPGRDLRRVLLALTRQGRGPPPAMAAYVMAEACDALDYAHHKRGADGTPLGVVHRDVSPSNIMISYEGTVKVIDFGIARAATRAAQTRTGSLKGKLHYMSPEQVRGKRVDHRSDIFSAGVVLYELLTGHRLFEGDSEPNIIMKVAKARVPRPSEVNPAVPGELEQIALRALAARRSGRYPAAGAMAAELRRWLVVGAKEPFGREQMARLMQELFPAEAAPGGAEPHAAPPEQATPSPAPAPALEGAWATSSPTRPGRGAASGRGPDEPTAPGGAQQARPLWRRLRTGAVLAGLLVLGVAGSAAVTSLVRARVEAVSPPPAPGAAAARPRLGEAEASVPFLVPLEPAPPPPAPPEKASPPLARPEKASPPPPPPEVASPPPRALGFLTVTAFPPAKVWIDGRPLARRTPLVRHALAAGRHTVRLVSDEGGVRELAVEIRAGETATEVVSLRR